MILQTLDYKNNCKGLFFDGEIIYGDDVGLPKSAEYAWKHSSSLDYHKYKYLFLYTHGKPLADYSTRSSLLQEKEQIIKAHQTAALKAKVSLGELCFFDLIPEHQLVSWLTERELAMTQIKKLSKPTDYDILHKIHVLTTMIAQQPVNYKGSTDPRIIYNMFGSSTGRLTTTKSSVPILTMKRADRHNLFPVNDAFLELDYNAAEVRTLIGLSGRKQPPGDIHEWVSKEVFSERYTREEAKVKLFSWLYNFSASENELSKIFSREIFRDFYFSKKQQIITPYGRVMAVEERKAQNYLLQSTTSDIVLENAYKIMNLLEGKKTRVAFTMHDSIVLDVSKEDLSLLKKIKREFESTPWGQFTSTSKIGKNYGDLREVLI